MNNNIEKVMKTINELKEQIKNQYKAEVVGMFGSYIRGEQKEGSDIDILVEFFKGADLFHFVGLSLFLEEKLGLKVDVVPYDTIREELKENILKEAIYL